MNITEGEADINITKIDKKLNMIWYKTDMGITKIDKCIKTKHDQRH